MQNISDQVRGELRELSNAVFQHEDAINDKTPIREIVPVIRIRDSIFAVKGDISIIGGLPKVGKTSVCAFLIATALLDRSPEGFDSLGIRTTYCQGAPVIYIDTEQPQAYTNKLRKQVLKLIGQSQHPQNLGIVNLRKYDSEKKLAKVLELMGKYRNAHLWIIDGIADLIKDPNDTKESFGVIEKFMMKSDELDTAIVLHIHENPGSSGKLRGNLGSEAERKAGGVVSIKKIKSEGSVVHAIEPKVIRGSADFDPIYFRYENGVPVSLSPAESEQVTQKRNKTAARLELLSELAKRCLQTGRLKYSDLVDRIVQVSPEVEGKTLARRTAENRIKSFIQSKIVVIDGDFYALPHI